MNKAWTANNNSFVKQRLRLNPLLYGFCVEILLSLLKFKEFKKTTF